MKSKTCKICGKIIEGYSKRHVNFLMMQHNLIHRKKERKENKNEYKKDR